MKKLLLISALVVASGTAMAQQRCYNCVDPYYYLDRRGELYNEYLRERDSYHRDREFRDYYRAPQYRRDNDYPQFRRCSRRYNRYCD